MLRILREGQRWIMGIVILVVGAGFVFFIGVGGPILGASHDVVVQVADQEFGRREVQRMRARQEEQLRQQLGDQYDPKLVDERMNLDALAANQLAQFGILAAEGERLGLRVSDEELREIIRRIPDFQDEQGKLSLERYRAFVNYEYGTERLFIQELRMQILVQKALALVASGVSVSDAEAREALRRRLESVKLAYVAIDTTLLPDGTEITDAQVDELVAKDEPRVRKFYDENPQRFHKSEQVHARHVLLRVPKDATPEQTAAIEKRMLDLRARLEKGEDFAAIAREASEDPGSKDTGKIYDVTPDAPMVDPFKTLSLRLEVGEA